MTGPYYVYEHWRPDKDVCFYVGKGKGDRAYIFKRLYNRRYNLVVEKLAKLGLCVEVRLVKGGLTEAESFFLEIERISFWRGAGVGLTNKTSGGDGTLGYRHSKTTREKISAAITGRILSAEARAKIRAANLGKKHSPEARAKMSAARMGNTNGTGGKGLKRSEDTRARMSIAQKGHPTSAETRAKISETLKRRHRALVSA